MKSSQRSIPTLSLLMAGLFVALAAFPLQAQQPPTPQSAPELERETIETFAEAYLDIADVREEMQIRLQSAQNENEANQIQQEANGQMEVILDAYELSIEEYQEITQILNSDPDQLQVFQEVVEELREEDRSALGQP